MKLFFARLLSFCLLTSFLSAQDLSKPRQWTSTAGSQIEASVDSIDIQRRTVKLVTPTGQAYNVQLAQLIEADRDLLKKWWLAEQEKEAKLKGTGAITEAEDGQLALFADGPWKNYNTVYEGPLYDALLNQSGILTIYPKSNGERIGKPLQAYIACYYVNQNRHNRRMITSFDDPPKPSHSTREMEFELSGVMEDNVKFEMDFKCEEDKVSVQGWVKDPAGQDFPSFCQTRIQMTATHTPPTDVTLAQLQEMTEGYSLTIRTTETSEEHPYWKGLTSQRDVKDILIKGPWEGNQLRVETPALRDRATGATDYGHFYIYSQNSPYQGYILYRNAASGVKKGRVYLHLREK
jgi:hypothetical protein